jgi:hypothetical protein
MKANKERVTGARKLISIGVAALCLSLAGALTGCSLLSSDSTQDANTAARLSEAEQELRTAQNNLNERKKNALAAREKANQARQEADALEKIAKKNNINTNDLNSRTYQARQAQTAAETAADKADGEVATATQAVQTAQARVDEIKIGTKPQSSPIPSDGDRNERTNLGLISTWIPLVVVTLPGLILLGIMSYLILRRIGDLRATTERYFGRLAGKQDERFQELKSSLSGLKDITTQLSNLDAELKRLSQIVGSEGAKPPLSSPQSGEHGDAPAEQIYHVRPIEIEDDIAQLPASANAFLARLSGEKPIMKYDPVKGLLVADPEGSGHLVLVQDQRVSGGMSYIVPAITRLQTKEEFYNHYEQYYDCYRPEDGEVWLQRLAVVEKVDGGWRLQEKGLLEIR